jgi:hypothetical protein
MGLVVNVESHQKKRFADFSNEPEPLQGEKCKIDDILNSEIEILNFRLSSSKFPKGESKRCLTLQFRQNEKLRIVFTGSNVLAKQIEQYQEEIPFFAKIKSIGRYFTLS